MNFVEPSVELIEEKDPYKKIELAGRTCYKSEAKITDDSSIKFVQNLIKREHYAMLEHQCFVFEVFDSSYDKNYIKFLKEDKYLNVTDDFVSVDGCNRIRYLVSGNVRAICQRKVNDPIYAMLSSGYPILCFNDILCENIYPIFSDCTVKFVDMNDLTYNFTDNELLKHMYFTFRIITDRGVTHELVRHRPCSFAQESTRYVNYKDGISIVLPCEFYSKPDEVQLLYQEEFECSERLYRSLIEYGETPQQARAVLPTALKTEIVVTTNLEEWNHIINLRYHGTTGAPHPNIKVVAEKIYNILKKDKMVGGIVA